MAANATVPGLDAELGITLGKLTQQLARAEARMAKTANKFETDFNRANKNVVAGVGNGLARAANKNSAALNTMTNSLSRAGKRGGAARFVFQNTTNQISDMAVQFEGGTAASRILAQQLPQLAGGFAALGGTLGLVMPLLGAVAAVGIPLGALFLTLGDDVEEAEEKVRTFAERLNDAISAVKSADKAMATASTGGIETLLERYGEVTEAVQDLAKELAEIEVRAARFEINGAINEALGEKFEKQISAIFGGVGGAVAGRTNEQLEMALRELNEFEAALANRQTAGMFVDPGELDILREMREEVAAISGDISGMGSLAAELKIDPQLLSQISQVRDDLGEALSASKFGEVASLLSRMRDLLRETGAEINQPVLDGLTQVEDLARQAANRLDEGREAAEGLSDATAGIADALDPAVSAAARLAVQMGVALDTAQSILALGPQGIPGVDAQSRGGRGGDPREFGGSAFDRQTAEGQAFLDAYKPPKKPGKGKKPKTSADIVDDAKGRLGQIKREMQLIGKSSHEVAMLTSKWELLDAAKKEGLNLDERLASTGRTLRDEINAQAVAIADLTEKADQAARRSGEFERAQNDLKEGFLDAALAGESFSGVLRDVAQSLARAAIQASLFGEGPFGGGGGGLFGNLFSGLFGGARAGGGPVSAGTPYAVNERTPNSEIFVPSRSGAVLNVTQAQAALRGSAGSGGVTVAPVFQIDARGAQADATQNVSKALEDILPRIERMAISAVKDGQRRGRV